MKDHMQLGQHEMPSVDPIIDGHGMVVQIAPGSPPPRIPAKAVSTSWSRLMICLQDMQSETGPWRVTPPNDGTVPAC